ncbi:hypothetical protein LINPERPRIM_LOCUS31420, partial [Linum perenne]
MATIRSIADYSKPRASNLRSPITVLSTDNDPYYEIQIPLLEMISRDIHFEGRPEDNPCTHLTDFLAVCDTFKSGNLNKNVLYLRAFPFSLRGAAKQWLGSKPPGHYTNWEALAQDFVEEYFPPARTTAYKDRISRFVQRENANLYDTWNEFQSLLFDCPHHGYEQRQLAEFFTRSMRDETANWVNSLAGGDCTALTPEDAMLHFANCASKSRNWERQIEGAKSQSQMSVEERVKAEVQRHLQAAGIPVDPPSATIFSVDCGWCGSCAHNGGSCLNFGSAEVWSAEEANFIDQGFANNQKGYAGYRNYVPRKQSNRLVDPYYRPPGFIGGQHQYQEKPYYNRDMDYERKFDQIMNRLDDHDIQLKAQAALNQGTRAQTQRIEDAVLSMAKLFNSNPLLNPEAFQADFDTRSEHAQAITTRSGKQTTDPKVPEPDVIPNTNAALDMPEIEDITEEEEEVLPPPPPSPKTAPEPVLAPYVPRIPFPKAARSKAKDHDTQYKKWYNVLKTAEIKIPVTEAMEIIPPLGKFFKDLVKKVKSGEVYSITLSSECASILSAPSPMRQPPPPPAKCPDPGSFTLPCIIN